MPSQQPSPRKDTAVEDALGALGVFVLGLGLLNLLWGRLADLAPGPRGGLLTLLTLAFFGLAGRLTRPDKDGNPPAPRTGKSLGLLALVALALGLGELGRAHHLPPSSLTWAALGVTGLLAAHGLRSRLLAGLGAMLLQGALVDEVAYRHGLPGAYLTDGVLVILGVGAALGLVGAVLLRGRWRLPGRGLVCWAAWTGTVSLLLLSLFGDGYHGRAGEEWIPHLYYAAFLLGGLASIKVAGRLESRLLSNAVTVLLCGRVLHSWIHFVAELLPVWAVFLSAGALIVVLAALLERVRGPGPDIPAEPAPAGPPPFGPHHQRALRLARVLAVVALGATVLRGAVNRLLPAAREAVAVRAEGGTPRLLFLALDLEAITAPPGLDGGAPLDLYLEPDRIEVDEPEAGVLWIRRAVAVRRGAPPPEELEAGRCLLVPARWAACRTFEGHPLRLVLPRHRWLFELPASLRTPEGTELVLRTGALGFPYPAARR